LDDRCGHVRGRAGGLPRPVGGTPQLAGWLVSHGVFVVGPQLHPTTTQPPSHARSPLMPSTTHACTIIVCCRVHVLGHRCCSPSFCWCGGVTMCCPLMPAPHNTHLLQIIRLKQVDHMKSEIVILTMINHPFIVNLYVGWGGGWRAVGLGYVALALSCDNPKRHTHLCPHTYPSHHHITHPQTGPLPRRATTVHAAGVRPWG
jgi:hypothetical protein